MSVSHLQSSVYEVTPQRVRFHPQPRLPPAGPLPRQLPHQRGCLIACSVGHQRHADPRHVLHQAQPQVTRLTATHIIDLL